MPSLPENTPVSPPDYVLRVNWAIDFILENLQAPLKLDDIAKVACFSPFHFHRVFKALLGETLSDFITRVRLERAIRIMSFDKNKSMTQVALTCGLGSSSNFSRVFKQQYGVPPSRFDIAGLREQRHEEINNSSSEFTDGLRLERLPPGENPDNFVIRMRELPERTVAYIRSLDPYRNGIVTGAVERLMFWAEARKLADGNWLGYMWDDPQIVAHKDCRYDVGLEVTDVTPEGEIGKLQFPAMLVAEVEMKGSIELEQRALDWLYGTWLPTSGYVPSAQPCFESWIGRPFAHGFEHFELNVQLPVERG
ncbi:MAG: AraC family transcriptional regulator [Planctomycetota bacterium]|jgi:AraC family transcriptional regulator